MQIYKHVSQAELTKKYKCFYLFSTIYLTFDEQPFRSKVELCKTKKKTKNKFYNVFITANPNEI